MANEVVQRDSQIVALRDGTIVVNERITSGSPYSLACALGTFSLSGKATGLVRGRTLACVVGTYSLAIADLVTRALGLSEITGAYALTGQAATLTYSHIVGSTYTLGCARGTYSFAIADTVTFGQNFVASAGTYALTGLPTVRKFTIGIAPGAYTLFGSAVGLSKTGAKSLFVNTGSYALNGVAANLVKGSRYTLVAAPGAYSLSGKTRTIARTLACGAGVYTLAIADIVTTSATLASLSASTGVYSINGLAATLTRATTRSLVCAKGAYLWLIANIVTTESFPQSTYMLTCASVPYTLAIANIVTTEVIPSGTYVLTCASGAFTINGAASTRDFTFEAATSNYTLNGATSTRDFTIELGTGSYTFAIANLVSIDAPNATLVASGTNYSITGRAAALLRTTAYSFTLNTGLYALNGILVRPAIGLPAETGTYGVSGKAATFSVAHKMSAAAGSYLFAGNQAVLNYSLGPLNRLVATTGVILVTSGGNVTLTRQRRLVASTGSYVVTGGQPVNLAYSRAFTLTGATGTYVVVGPTTVLRFGRALSAARGTYSLTGVAAAFSLHHSYIFTTDTGPYIVNGNAAALPPPPAGAGVPRNIPFIATMGAMTAR